MNFSPHKFVGGPQPPGVLAIRRQLVDNRVPSAPGGGTVSFVSPTGHRYLDDPVAREEGGTPGIVESIRAGLVVGLKQAVGTDLIQAREDRFWRRALERWRRNPRIEILGNQQARRLPIVSFRIRLGPRYLHHNFVVAVLNDLFGVQARGGCSCAGPYGHRLLGDYRFEPRAGLWRHRSGPTEPARSLADLHAAAIGAPSDDQHRPLAGEDTLAGHLQQARLLLAARPDRPEDGPTGLSPALEALRDFHLPPNVLDDSPDPPPGFAA